VFHNEGHAAQAVTVCLVAGSGFTTVLIFRLARRSAVFVTYVQADRRRSAAS